MSDFPRIHSGQACLFCPTGWSVWLTLRRWERPKSLAIQRTKRASGSFVLRKKAVDEAGWLGLHTLHNRLIDRKAGDDDGVNLRAESLNGWIALERELREGALNVRGAEEMGKELLTGRTTTGGLRGVGKIDAR